MGKQAITLPFIGVYGNQDVNGVKSFPSGYLNIKSSYDISQTPATYRSNNIVFKDSTDRDIGYLENGQDQLSVISGLFAVNKNNQTAAFRVLISNTDSTAAAVASPGVSASIDNWGMPKYSSAVAISNTGSYTAPSNGFAIITLTGSSGGETFAYISNVKVAIGWYTSTLVGERVFIPMATGDVLTWDTARIVDPVFTPCIGG